LGRQLYKSIQYYAKKQKNDSGTPATEQRGGPKKDLAKDVRKFPASHLTADVKALREVEEAQAKTPKR